MPVGLQRPLLASSQPLDPDLKVCKLGVWQKARLRKASLSGHFLLTRDASPSGTKGVLQKLLVNPAVFVGISQLWRTMASVQLRALVPSTCVGFASRVLHHGEANNWILSRNDETLWPCLLLPSSPQLFVFSW